VALARALYREAPILLIVSHRLPIIEFADRIYVMLKGEIVEQGTHAELIRRDGVYARLFGIRDLERTLGMSLTI
jgi:ABC-type multidrug transport system fused ATPase/permease subunit